MGNAENMGHPPPHPDAQPVRPPSQSSGSSTPPVTHSITSSHHLRAVVESLYGDLSIRLLCDHHPLGYSGATSQISFSLASCGFCLWSWSLPPLLHLPSLPPDL